MCVSTALLRQSNKFSWLLTCYVFLSQVPLVSKQSLQLVSVGHVIDLISNDIQRMELAPRWVIASSMLLIEIPVVIFSLLYWIGWQSLMGAFFLILTVPYIIRLSVYCAKFRQQTARVTDKRISLMDELVSGIRAIKANAWEDQYVEKIEVVRR